MVRLTPGRMYYCWLGRGGDGVTLFCFVLFCLFSLYELRGGERGSAKVGNGLMRVGDREREGERKGTEENKMTKEKEK